MDVVLRAQAEELPQAGAVDRQPAALLEQFVAVVALVEPVREHAHGLDQREQRGVEPGLGKALLAQADDRLLLQPALAQKIEELRGGVQRVLDELLLARAAELVQQAALARRVPQVFQQAVGAVAAEPQAEMLGGDLGHGLRLVEHHEVVGKQHAAGAALVGRAARAQVGEQQAVVDDDDLGVAQPGAGPLVETDFAVAVFAAAGGGIGVDGVPDLGRRRRVQLVDQPVAGLPRPGGDALQLRLVGAGKKFLAARQGVREAGGAEVVGLAHEHGGFEFRVGVELAHRLEQAAAEGQVHRLDLLLEGDRVGRDDQLPRLIHRMDDARHEVGEALAHAGAGLEQQHLVIAHRRGHGTPHLLLLRAVLEAEPLLQPAVRGEHRRRQRGSVAFRRRRGAGVVAKTDHGMRLRRSNAVENHEWTPMYTNLGARSPRRLRACDGQPFGEAEFPSGEGWPKAGVCPSIPSFDLEFSP